MSVRCPRCDGIYPNGANFCTKDGTRLVPMPSSAPVPPAASAPPPAHPGLRRHRGTTTRDASPAPPAAGSLELSKLVGQVLDDRYRVAKKLGEGGMSHVFLALDITSGERVAIKILSPSLSKDKSALARLRREAALGSRLAHPNVCHIIRMGETEYGLIYIVMPYIEGELLCDITYRAGQLSLEHTVRFVRDIAAGLHVAHTLGIIHRDLKPENVIISAASGQERAVVMDFGLAKERRVGPEIGKLTATGIVLGTPEFMSPEQLRGKPLDPRSDIYSLALMAYEMLTGKLPFIGRSQQDVMIARLKGDPLPLREVRPELSFPPRVNEVLAKALARDPAQRYATAPEMAEALESAASGKGGSGVLGRLLGR
jgi:serine/threonine protein kinase